jgi:hypothetical protein
MCIHCPTGRRMFAHPKPWRNKQNYETLHFWTTEWHFWVSRLGTFKSVHLLASGRVKLPNRRLAAS